MITSEQSSSPDYQAEVLAKHGVMLPKSLAIQLRHRNPDQTLKALLGGYKYSPEQHKTVWEDIPEFSDDSLERVKAALLSVPLYHATADFFDGDIKPDSLLGGESANTLALDRSLGLDECTFMHWGPFRYDRYGNKGYLIDPQVLFDQQTFVTPSDIASLAGLAEWGEPYTQIGFNAIDDERTLDAIHRGYFDKLVSGRAWLDISARYLLAGKVEGAYSQFGFQIGGEVKYFGAIPREMIIGEIHSEEQFRELSEKYKIQVEQAIGAQIPYQDLQPPSYL